MALTEAQLAARLHRDLGPLAVDAGWKTTGQSGQTYGTYTDCIADALGALGIAPSALQAATTATGTDAASIKAAAAVEARVRRLALAGALDRLEAYYAGLVDTVEGPVSHKLSQVFANIERMRASLSVGESVASGTNLRGRRRPDYALGVGNVSYGDAS